MNKVFESYKLARKVCTTRILYSFKSYKLSFSYKFVSVLGIATLSLTSRNMVLNHRLHVRFSPRVSLRFISERYSGTQTYNVHSHRSNTSSGYSIACTLAKWLARHTCMSQWHGCEVRHGLVLQLMANGINAWLYVWWWMQNEQERPLGQWKTPSANKLPDVTFRLILKYYCPLSCFMRYKTSKSGWPSLWPFKVTEDEKWWCRWTHHVCFPTDD